MRKLSLPLELRTVVELHLRHRLNWTSTEPQLDLSWRTSTTEPPPSAVDRDRVRITWPPSEEGSATLIRSSRGHRLSWRSDWALGGISTEESAACSRQKCQETCALALVRRRKPRSLAVPDAKQSVRKPRSLAVPDAKQSVYTAPLLSLLSCFEPTASGEN